MIHFKASVADRPVLEGLPFRQAQARHGLRVSAFCITVQVYNIPFRGYKKFT